MQGLTLGESGIVICSGKPGTCKGEKPDAPVDLATQPVLGEPLGAGLVSAGGSIRALVKTVPIPLRSQDGGCSIDATLLTPGAELVWIEASGFPAGKEATFDSDSDGERQTKQVRVDADGTYSTAILPYKQGQRSGTIRVTLKSTACSPTVNLPWGRRNSLP